MNKTLALLLAVNLLAFGSQATGADHPELKAFPAAREGMERFVIVLPHKERGEEDDFMVELNAGRTLLADGVNQMLLGNSIEPRTLEGWGYTYYEVTGPSVVINTLMAPPEGAPMVERFVSAAPLRIRYNSRLPIVIYAPEGYEARYRIWQASETTGQAIKG
ncbi:MAG: ecotin family protein [Gammaproteobacteria bacterium]